MTAASSFVASSFADSSRPHPVAHSADGANKPRLGRIVAEFHSQVPDVHVDNVLVPKPSWAPHSLNELPSRQRRTASRCHCDQQVELSPRHLDEAAVDVQGSRLSVEAEPTHLDLHGRAIETRGRRSMARTRAMSSLGENGFTR